MNIFIVSEAHSDEPPIAAFADEADAKNFIEHGEFLGDPVAKMAVITELELWYGQRLWGQK